MSRIHEALKRAEEERAASHNGQKGEDLAERNTAGEVIQAGVTPPNILAPALVPQVTTETLPEALRFEELWAKCARPQWKPGSDLLVFGNPNPFNPGAEQFRTLRSRLYKMRESQPLHTLLISSSISAEGKTLVAANLAQAMVRQHGCRVLLIDADLRAPHIHSLLGAPATPGLADYLQGGANEFEVIQRGYEEGLCFIPAGNGVTHPSELISSSRLKQFFERVEPAFDWVLVDSPPALPVADASVLGGMCDGVLLVVRANATPSETAQKACRELGDTNVIGVVLNTVKEAADYGAYYTYGTGTLAHSEEPPKYK